MSLSIVFSLIITICIGYFILKFLFSSIKTSLLYRILTMSLILYFLLIFNLIIYSDFVSHYFTNLKNNLQTSFFWTFELTSTIKYYYFISFFEEFIKLICSFFLYFIFLIYLKNTKTPKLNIIFLSIFISAISFSTIENILYTAWNALNPPIEIIYYALWRIIYSLPMHISTTSLFIISSPLIIYLFKSKKHLYNLLFILFIYFCSSSLHTLYNISLIEKNEFNLVLLICYIIFYISCIKIILLNKKTIKDNELIEKKELII